MSPEEKHEVLRRLGRDPLKEMIVEKPDGGISVVPNPYKDEGAFGAFVKSGLRGLAPAAAGTVLGGGAAAGTMALGASTGVGALPAALAAIPIGAGAGVIGTLGAEAAIPHVLKHTMGPEYAAGYEEAGYRRAQQHPFASSLGSIGSSLLTMKPSLQQLRDIKDLPKLINASRLVTGGQALGQDLPRLSKAAVNLGTAAGIQAKPAYDIATDPSMNFGEKSALLGLSALSTAAGVPNRLGRKLMGMPSEKVERSRARDAQRSLEQANIARERERLTQAQKELEAEDAQIAEMLKQPEFQEAQTSNIPYQSEGEVTRQIIEPEHGVASATETIPLPFEEGLTRTELNLKDPRLPVAPAPQTSKSASAEISRRRTEVQQQLAQVKEAQTRLAEHEQLLANVERETSERMASIEGEEAQPIPATQEQRQGIVDLFRRRIGERTQPRVLKSEGGVDVIMPGDDPSKTKFSLKATQQEQDNVLHGNRRYLVERGLTPVNQLGIDIPWEQRVREAAKLGIDPSRLRAAGAYKPETRTMVQLDPTVETSRTGAHEAGHATVEAFASGQNRLAKRFAERVRGDESVNQGDAEEQVMLAMENLPQDESRLGRYLRENLAGARYALGSRDSSVLGRMTDANTRIYEGLGRDLAGTSSSYGPEGGPVKYGLKASDTDKTDTRITDSEGKPITLYHGTKKGDFDPSQFRTDTGYKHGPGAYFTPRPEYASRFANPAEQDEPVGARIYPTHVSLKKPYVTSNEYGISELGESLQERNRHQYNRIAAEIARETGRDIDEIRPEQVANRWLRTKGYDGIIEYTEDGKVNEVAAFDADRIRSLYRPESEMKFSLKLPTATMMDAAINSRPEYERPLFRSAYKDFFAHQARIKGIGGNANYGLSEFPPAVLESVARKLHLAQTEGTIPSWTPDEQAAEAIFRQGMSQIWDENVEAGRPMKGKDPYYLPEHWSPSALQGMMKDRTMMPIRDRFIRYNQRLNPGVPVETISEHFDSILSGIRDGRGVGEEFNPLHKAARQFHIPPEDMTFDLMNVNDRYFARAANDIATERAIKLHEPVRYAHALSMEGRPDNPRGVEEGLQGMSDVFSGAVNIPSRGSRRASEVLRGAHSLASGMAVQGTSGLRNLLQMPVQFGRNMNTMDDASDIAHAVLGLPREYTRGRDEAIRTGAWSPARSTSQFVQDEPFTTTVGRTLDSMGNAIRSLGPAKKLEEFSRTIQYLAGEKMAKRYWKNPSEPGYEEFMKSYANGLDPSKSDAENISRMAANYVRSNQTSYGPEDLPEWMVTPNTIGILLRLNRFSMGQYNRVANDVINPALAGDDYKPLLWSTLGTIMSGAAIAQFNNLIRQHEEKQPTWREIKEANIKDQGKMAEYTLKVLDLIQKAGTLGIVGDVGGKVAKNIGGTPTAVMQSPVVDIGQTVLLEAAKQFDAAREGADPMVVIMDVIDKAILDQVQDIHTVKSVMKTPAESQERQDIRNKAVFSKLHGIDKPSGVEIVRGALGVPPLSAEQLTRDAEGFAQKEGDASAEWRKLIGSDRQPGEVMDALVRARSHPGMYADTKENRPRNMLLLDWINKSRGNESDDPTLGQQLVDRAIGRRRNLGTNLQQAMTPEMRAVLQEREARRVEELRQLYAPVLQPR